MLAADAQGKNVVTVEGLGGEEGGGRQLQQASVDKGEVQCGFCRPGMIITAKSFLDETPPGGTGSKIGYLQKPLPLHRLQQDHRGDLLGERKEMRGRGFYTIMNC